MHWTCENLSKEVFEAHVSDADSEFICQSDMETSEDAVGSPINETSVDVVRSVPITYSTGDTVETQKHSPIPITLQPSPSDQPPMVVQMQGTYSQSSSLVANTADSGTGP